MQKVLERLVGQRELFVDGLGSHVHAAHFAVDVDHVVELADELRQRVSEMICWSARGQDSKNKDAYYVLENVADRVDVLLVTRLVALDQLVQQVLMQLNELVEIGKHLVDELGVDLAIVQHSVNVDLKLRVKLA